MISYSNLKKFLVTFAVALFSISGIHGGKTKYPEATTVYLPELISPKSNDEIDQLILKYVPQAWFASGEPHKGISFERYVTHPETGVFYDLNHRKNKKLRNPKTVIPAGEVTMEKLGSKEINNRTTYPNAGDGLYMQGSDALDNGENPKTVYRGPNGETFMDEENGIKKTPVYAFYSESEHGKHAHIQYFYFYGYNGYYGIHIPWSGPLSYVNFGYAGNHKMDLEHIILEFDINKSGKNVEDYVLKRIGYNTHGSGEMKWILANDKKYAQFTHFAGEDTSQPATHPVAYLAKNGHGLYPGPGTWLRICGEGNDDCNKGQAWEGSVVRFTKKNKTFKGFKHNQKTMGITEFIGDLGPEGVGGLVEKNYLQNGIHEDGGLTKKEWEKVYCEEGNVFYNTWCVSTTRPNSCYIPESYHGTIKSGHVFAPNMLPYEQIIVTKGSHLIFKKHATSGLPYEHNKKVEIKPQALKTDVLGMKADPIEAVKIDDMGDHYKVTFPYKGHVNLMITEHNEYSNDYVGDIHDTPQGEQVLVTVTVK